LKEQSVEVFLRSSSQRAQLRGQRESQQEIGDG
jgi:hypothetical protein